MWLMLNFYCEFSVGLKLMWPMLILIIRIYMGSRYYFILFFGVWSKTIGLFNIVGCKFYIFFYML